MGIDIWIAIVLIASALSAWIGYSYAAKKAPSQSDLDAMAAELEVAREQAESVQANVNEHFEQSARLFGKLAQDYREFLDHFSDSAQALGLSESRARELIEQGFQPLITHEEVVEVVEAEADTGEGAPSPDDQPARGPAGITEDADAPSAVVDVQMPEKSAAAENPAVDEPQPGRKEEEDDRAVDAGADSGPTVTELHPEPRKASS